METKLIALNAELELIREEYKVIYDKMIANLDKIINKYFVEPFDAKCTRRWFREDFYPKRGIDIDFEIGFHNVEENKLDFGSDMWFEYCTSKGQLKVNHGTCGYYSKEDIYQVKRIKALAHVWNHIDEIEAELDNYAAEVTPIVIEYNDKIYDLEQKISSIKQAIKDAEKAKIEADIVLDAVMYYDLDRMLYSRQALFFDACRVTKITPKFVTLTATNGTVYKVKKESLINHIMLGYVIIEG